MGRPYFNGVITQPVGFDKFCGIPVEWAVS